MSKKLDIKSEAEKILKEFGISDTKKILKELEKLIQLTKVKIYYSGNLGDDKKEIISNWIKNKVKGDYDTEYISDETLISGLKIVYKDFNYEDTIVSEINKLEWQQK